MPVALFLSPHLDDAVFSCAGRILNEKRAGAEVIIATLFSHCGKNSDRRLEYHSRRREDRAAARRVGAKTIWLGLPDAPSRCSYYCSFRTLIFGEAPGESDWKPKIAQHLEDLVGQLQPDRIYAPLAVGNHIDHRLTFEAALKLKHPPSSRLFYEERPYALVPHATAWRLACVNGSDDECLMEIARAYWRCLLHAPYVRAYLPPGPERKLCREALLAGHGSDADGRMRWRRDIHPIAAKDFPSIRDASFAYKSQAEVFLGPPQAFLAASRRHARTIGFDRIRAEQLWRVKAA
jgi:hypothetical protein